jgi:VIT1/CCC1 family predicted Fe2+/Mn2+ transporter
MLFLVGIEYARLTDKNPIFTAVGLVLLGGVVVLVTILLGG